MTGQGLLNILLVERRTADDDEVSSDRRPSSAIRRHARKLVRDREPHAPELNPAERLWEDLKDALAFEDALAFDLFESLAALKATVETLLAEYTRQALASLAGVKHLVEAATPTMDNSLAWLV